MDAILRNRRLKLEELVLANHVWNLPKEPELAPPDITL